MNQHEIEREKNRISWEKKNELREEYARFYELMRQELAPGRTLELGSGLGKAKDYISQLETSELEPTQGIDRVESAYAIACKNGEFSNLLMLDVWHHLESPRAALKEFDRALRPGGHVVMLEPGMGLLGNLIYGLAHHEPVGWKTRFEPTAPDAPGYFACQSSGHRHFVNKEFPNETAGWRVQTKTFSALGYLSTGGFSKKPIGKHLRALLKRCEPIADRCPEVFGSRLLIRLEKL